MVEAVQEQSARFLHTDFTVVPYEGYVELAERLGALVPIAGSTRAAFFNAGTEAVENAVKFARLYTGRPAVIAFEGAFHGRTLLSLTMTSKAVPYKLRLGPFAPEVYRAPYPNPYRGVTAEEALAQLERMLVTHVPPEHVAAIVFEPQQGEGGFIPAPAAFVEGCARSATGTASCSSPTRCRPASAARRGCSPWSTTAVEPDLIVVAKSIAAGLPLSGVIGRAEIMDAGHTGAVGGTFIGNPVALAAALAVLDVFEEERLVERAGDARRPRSGSACSPGSSATRRSGTCVASGRCSRIELVRDPRDERAGARARRGGDRRCAAAWPDPAQGRRGRKLHPRPVPAHDRRRRARRGARRVGGRAGAVTVPL